jgi:hypothetical protein
VDLNLGCLDSCEGRVKRLSNVLVVHLIRHTTGAPPAAVLGGRRTSTPKAQGSRQIRVILYAKGALHGATAPLTDEPESDHSKMMIVGLVIPLG